MKFIPYDFITHTMKVKSLYKKFLRDIHAWNNEMHEIRIQSVLMRQKFDEKRDIRDPIKAKKELEEAEELYRYTRHPEPIRFPTSFEGPAFERHETCKMYDGILDFWHPLERAQYPDYFARREQRKKEFVEWYDKKFGKPKFEMVDS